MVSAIEVSADFHLSHLIKAIKAKDPGIELFGLAGHHCAEQGVRLTADLTQNSTIGFLEPLKYLPALLYRLWQAKQLLVKTRPDLLIVVDGQGFNIPLAAFAKKLGVKVIYYIAPQEWQWGTEQGGRKVLAVVDAILAIFKEEAEFYQRLGGTAYFNGHPLLDIVQPKMSKQIFFRQSGLDINKPLLGLFPGSRWQELKYLLPVMVNMAGILRREKPGLQFVFSAATPFCSSAIKKAAKGLPVLEGQNYDIMAHSDLIMTATGTATLEAACLLKPMIAVYKFSPLSHWLIVKAVGKRIPKYAALPNIWLNKMAVPEFIQKGVEPRNLADDVLKLLENPGLRSAMVQELKGLTKILGQKGALAKNAEIVIGLLQGK